MSELAAVAGTGAVLSGAEIKSLVESGHIKISHFDASHCGPASYDLSLGHEFRVFKAGLGVVDIKEKTDYKDITEKIDMQDGKPFILPPGQLCLGITRETVELPNNLCGILEGRSRFARLGLVIHITASLIAPNISNRQVLEIYNASSNPLALYPGEYVCQLAFLKMNAPASYKGKFQHQEL
jgi:dCTP deaminase